MPNIKLKQVKIHFKYESGQRYTAKGNICNFGFDGSEFSYSIKVIRDGHKVTETHHIPLVDVKSIAVHGPEGFSKSMLNGYQKVVYTIKNGKLFCSTGYDLL